MLLRYNISIHNWDCYCLNCVHCFITDEKHNSHEKWKVLMCNEENNISKYNHSKKSIKTLSVIYPDFEAVLRKTSTCDNDLGTSFIAEINKQTDCDSCVFI